MLGDFESVHEIEVEIGAGCVVLIECDVVGVEIACIVDLGEL